MRFWSGLILLIGTILSSGCAVLAVGGGVAGLAYVAGESDRTYPFPLEVVWDATCAAVDDLQLAPGYQAKDQLVGRIDRYTSGGDRIRIKLFSQGTSTKMKVRVNTFGNKSMTQTIIHRVEQYLPHGAPPPMTPVPEGPVLPPGPTQLP